MNLSLHNLKNIHKPGIIKPGEAIFVLPEKVLQFGTGVLLRGLPDYFIDKANRSGIFNGRIVVVKSTDAGDANVFNEQDALYTLCIRGVENGKKTEENIICSAISRVLSAKQQWNVILQCAQNPAIQIIISNTTEAGLQFVKEDIHQEPPTSFPAKLLTFLYERYKAFHGIAASGLVIVPTELITDNGEKLKSIVLELAAFNQLEEAFIQWLLKHNRFCNSLVDRIVPGKPGAAIKQQLEDELGYGDELLTVSELYCLWAIEGDDHVKSILSFAQADKGVIIETNIEIYKELKLRLLNGTHTLSCGLAYLSGIATVKEAMENESFSKFISNLMFEEITPAIPYALPANAAHDFGLRVLDRFRNPHIQHQWISITMQYSLKVKMRTIPVLLRYFELFKRVPEYFSLGFAAYLLFMKAVKKENDKFFGQLNGKFYLINDDKARYYYELWQGNTAPEIVVTVLQDQAFWETDLFQLSGFAASVTEKLEGLIDNGAGAMLISLK